MEAERTQRAPDLLAAARKAIAADDERRATICQTAIGQILARHGCRLEAQPVPGPGPGLWTFAIIVVPQESSL